VEEGLGLALSDFFFLAGRGGVERNEERCGRGLITAKKTSKNVNGVG